MNVQGIIKNAETEQPLDSAKLTLIVDNRELAVLYSDSDGKFSHEDSGSFNGQVLYCAVEKDGYKAKKVSHTVESDTVQLAIEVVPDVTPVIISCKVIGEKSSALSGAKVTITVDNNLVCEGFTDTEGVFSKELSGSLENRVADCRIQYNGYRTTDSRIEIARDKTTTFTLRKKTKIPWLVAGLVVLVILLVVFFVKISGRGPKPPKKVFFPPKQLHLSIVPKGIMLQWIDVPANEIGFKIYRYRNCDPKRPEVIGTTGANELEFLDSLVHPQKGEKYVYAVSAVYKTGVSKKCEQSITKR